MTVSILAVYFVLLVIIMLAWAMFLRLGLYWAKVEDATWRGVLLVALVVAILENVIRGMILAGVVVFPAAEWPLLFLLSAELLVVPCVAVILAYRLPIKRGIMAWLPTLLTPLVLIPVLLLVVNPFLLDAYVLPTNSMAPTLLGPHLETNCPTCGGLAYGNLPFPWKPRPQAQSLTVICEDHFHVTEIADPQATFGNPDRIHVVKFARPQRWDLVAFRVPADPEVIYVKRLVGLPGETITIENGKVHANGKPLELPEDLKGLEYADPVDGRHFELAATPDSPAKLGPGEYFVLGDFSVYSNDSRMWQRGAEGHPPYAVPESHLIGVVTHRYWPVRRWRAFH